MPSSSFGCQSPSFRPLCTVRVRLHHSVHVHCNVLFLVLCHCVIADIVILTPRFILHPHVAQFLLIFLLQYLQYLLLSSNTTCCAIDSHVLSSKKGYISSSHHTHLSHITCTSLTLISMFHPNFSPALLFTHPNRYSFHTPLFLSSSHPLILVSLPSLSLFSTHYRRHLPPLLTLDPRTPQPTPVPSVHAPF